MKVKIKLLNKDTVLPKYETDGSAGLDLCASTDKDIIIKPFKRELIKTGIAISIPNDYEIQIRPRSGLALKNGITVLNTPGTVDSDFRGEIAVILINFGENDFIVKNGMRIAQMIINKIEKISFEEVEILDETKRGNKGFGSTGV